MMTVPVCLSSVNNNDARLAFGRGCRCSGHAVMLAEVYHVDPSGQFCFNRSRGGGGRGDDGVYATCERGPGILITVPVI